MSALSVTSGVPVFADRPDLSSEPSPAIDRVNPERPGLRLRLFRNRGPDDLQLRPLDGDLLIVLLRGTPIVLHARDGRTYQERAMPGDLSLAPVGLPTRLAWDRPVDALCIHLRSDLVRRTARGLAEPTAERVELCGRFRFRDPLVERLGLLLLAERESGGVASRSYTAALSNLLAAHLLRHHSTIRPGGEANKVGLPRHKLVRALDHIEANLSEGLCLATMARVVQLSPSHFSRLFKGSTGLTPRQYVEKERVERAKRLLAARRLSLAEVAAECGFPGQNHFTTVFHEATGSTPKRWRDAL